MGQKIYPLSLAIVFSLVPVGAFAQESVEENNADSELSVPHNLLSIPDSNIFKTDLSSFPELPFLQPILPEVDAIRLLIKLKERKVYVYKGDKILASYPIAVGKLGWETPTGEFKVIEMIENPGWTNPFTGEIIPPGPNSPLGERWIAFWTDGKNYIGFHGTPNENSVGQAASHGCIRMFNKDVRALYELVSVGTVVRVEP